MKNKRLIKIIIIIFILLIITMPFYLWKFKGSSSIKAIILDKTVPTEDYREHKNIMWILNNKKILNEYTNAPFEYNQDYYGFFPYKLNENSTEDYFIKEFPEELDNDLDLIYLADTYGVHNNDYELDNFKYEDLSYGGINNKELDEIYDVLNAKVIIGEFNIFNSPTQGEARQRTMDIFGVEWSGWIARYFKDLSKSYGEVPNWIIQNYEKQYQEEWNKEGTGIVYVHEDGQVFVLENEKHLSENYVYTSFTDEAKSEYNLKDNVKFYYWYEILTVKDDAKVLGSFNIDVTEEGSKVLRKYGLDTSYPAFIEKRGDYNAYYMACDASDNSEIMKNYKVEFYTTFMNKLSIDNTISNKNFFWKCYYPFFNKILDEIVG